MIDRAIFASVGDKEDGSVGLCCHLLNNGHSPLRRVLSKKLLNDTKGIIVLIESLHSLCWQFIYVTCFVGVESPYRCSHFLILKWSEVFPLVLQT